MKKILSAFLSVCIAVCSVIAILPAASAQENGVSSSVSLRDRILKKPQAELVQPQKVKTGADFTENVALNKPVTVSGLEVSDGRWTGDKAVDGYAPTGDDSTENQLKRWSSAKMKNGSSGTETTSQTPQWLVIDLGAPVDEITSIKISYFKLCWAQLYTIRTGDSFDGTAQSLDSFETVKSHASMRPNSDSSPVDEFTDISSLKRYVAFYFEQMNPRAGGNSLSVSEIEITAKTAAPANSAAVMNGIDSLSLDENERYVVMPEIHDNYEFNIIGTQFDSIITAQGYVTEEIFEDKDVVLLCEVINKNNPLDRAEKNFTVTVHKKIGSDIEEDYGSDNPNERPKVIPAVAEWYGFEGKFKISSKTRIIYETVDSADNAVVDEAARRFSADLEEILGVKIPVINIEDLFENAQSEEELNFANDISIVMGSGLVLGPSSSETLKKEGYEITADPAEGLVISAKSVTGVLYGTYTVMQSMLTSGDYSFPYGMLRDYPEFKVRGVMLDVARSPFRFETLEEYQKLLSWFKINEFHVHINDDRHQGNNDMPDYSRWENVESMFRLENETFPSLTTTPKTSEYFNSSDGFGGTPVYTKEQWRQFQKDGEALGINVITEIDLPAHALALTSYVHNYPEEAASAGISGPVNSSRHWELMALSGSNYENSRKMMNAVYSEYINGVNGGEPTFITDTVHIGADEYWNITSAEKAGFKNYLDDISTMVKNKGKKVRMWGGISRFIDSSYSADYSDIELDIWDCNAENVSARLNEGYNVVNVCNNYLYNNALRDNRDVVNAEHLYENWNPYIFTNYTAKTADSRVMGAKAAIWQDVTDMGVTEADNTERLVRAASVLAEKTWGGTGEQTFEDFSLILSRIKNGAQDLTRSNGAENAYCLLDLDFANVKNGEAVNLADQSRINLNGITVEKDGEDTYAVFNKNGFISTGLKSVSYPYTVSFDIKSGSNTSDAFLFSGTEGWVKPCGMNGMLSVSRAFFNQNFGYTLPQNTKTNITIVGTQEALKLYVNGEFVKFLGRRTASETDYNNLSSTFVFPLEYIGKNFSGRLANIKVYSRAFSPQSVKASYNDRIENYINVSQNKGTAGNAQNIGLGGWDTGWKKLRVAWKATDGDGNALGGQNSTEYSEKDSYFEGAHADSSMIVDLWKDYGVSKIVLQWDRTPASFKLQSSQDGKTWTDIRTFTAGSSAASVTSLELETPINARFVKMQGISIHSADTFKLREFTVFEKADKEMLAMYSTSLARYCEILKKDVPGITAQALSAARNPFADSNLVNEMTEAVLSSADENIPSSAIALGDVNFDGVVNIKDATLVQKYAVDIVNYSRINAFAADADESGEINGADAVSICKQILFSDKQG